MFAHGAHGLIEVATQPDVDIVLCASSGTAALEAVLAAIDAGKTIALANKEVLVMAGALVMEAARAPRAWPILPVDSEHNAIHQCLHGRRDDEVTRLILTASGGPFRECTDGAAASTVTPEAALSHPTWKMGRKITIDSATLMNKGLEVIEARWLFDVRADRIDVVIHPQSVVHSLVELRDGSVIAQLGVTDMRLPIQYAFSYPERWDGALPRARPRAAARLEFFEPDHAAVSRAWGSPIARSAAGPLARRRAERGQRGRGGGVPRRGACRSPGIPRVIEQALEAHAGRGARGAARPRRHPAPRPLGARVLGRASIRALQST